jgi:N-acetylmuramoyl-L-alanine amidase CwlA
MSLKKVPRYVYIFLVAGLFVIIFAFFMESRANRGSDVSSSDVLPTKSEIQEELDNLDWVEQMFLPVNPFSRPGTKLESINGIVIHNIGNPNTTALQNRNYFENLATTQERYASSNFIICLDGSVIQCIPVDEIAYASNVRNDDTLSIEICHPDDTGRFTEESYDAAVRLTAWLCIRYGLTSEDVIRHYDVQGKVCPLYFVENEDAWIKFRADVARAIRQ